MIDTSTQVGRLKEFDGIKITNVDSPIIWIWTLGTILLNMETKETDVDIVNLLEGEHGLKFWLLQKSKKIKNWFEKCHSVFERYLYFRNDF